ncbi:hypothetical protein [Photobacterium damselae]|uniref:hypothetical protein n=1 Tax=Photobacterium damselae TaxID=38293 RepID=UPI0025432BB9
MKKGLILVLLSIFSFASNAELWDKNKTYNAGDVVEWNNATYVSISWSQNKVPKDNVNGWYEWVIFEPQSVMPWGASEVYQGGDIVEYKNQYYLARWWNEKSTPENNEAWVRLDIETAVTDQDKIDDLTESNQIPNLDRSDELLGVDDDNNGIRDDIDAFIEFHYKDEKQKKAVKQLAGSLQKTLVADTSDIINVKKLNRDNTRAINCIFSRFSDVTIDKSPEQVTQEIESITSNTKARLIAYLAFNSALDGTSWAIPEGDTCE